MGKNKIRKHLNYKLLGLALLGLLVWSCDLLLEEQGKTRIASVGDVNLYLEDLPNLMVDAVDKADSTAIVKAYINTWATEQLLLKQAKLNLPVTTQERFNGMVKEYESSLFIEAYKNTYVSEKIDSSITKASILKFYEENKENFHLNNELLKVRYISLGNDYSGKEEVVKALKRFDEEDQAELTKKSYQFKRINLNDSVWVQRDLLLSQLPIFKENAQELKKSNFIELQDSLGVYLLKVEDRLERNDIAPLAFIEPTIKQILINIQKLELVKKLEKDITKDAVKDKMFQVYTP